jgi:starch phosphorylase
MNGGLIIGTLDGANVEICEEVGNENMFIFGAKINEVEKLKEKMHNTPPQNYICQELKTVFSNIEEGRFGSKEILLELIDSIRHNNDQYLVCEDFPSYMQAQ